MKTNYLLSLLICIAFNFNALSQWRGDTASFDINGETVQLNAEALSSTKILYKASDAIKNASWELMITLDFNPSSSNFCRIYFCSDNSDFTLANAYFIQCGSSDDDIGLYKTLQGTETLLVDGLNNRLNNPSNTFYVKVTRDEHSKLDLYFKNASEEQYIKEGSITDTSVNTSLYFALQCVYTSTRSNKFTFQNISITGDAIPDTVPPYILNAQSINGRTIKLVFNEVLKPGTEQVAFSHGITVQSTEVKGNILHITTNETLKDSFTVHIQSIEDLFENTFTSSINLNYKAPDIVSVLINSAETLLLTTSVPLNTDSIKSHTFLLGNLNLTLQTKLPGNSYLLHSATPIPQDTELLFVAKNLIFENGDKVSGFSIPLFYRLPKLFDVVITEIMADPDPALNYQYEYVELYNRKNYAVNLTDWSISIDGKLFVIPAFTLQPLGYAVLSKGALSIPENLTWEAFPTLPNNAFRIELNDGSGKTIDCFDYNSAMHAEPFKREGGWSLERNNPNVFQHRYNWESCTDYSGGTPGKPNSVLNSQPDIMPPFVQNLFPESTTKFTLFFNEPIKSLNKTNITNSSFAIETITPYYANRQFVIQTTEELAEKTLYPFTLSNIADFGNNIYNGSYTVALPEQAEQGEILINEIMFDPLAGNPEFIELYNHSGKTIDAATIFLTQRDDSNHMKKLLPISSENILIYPDSYIVISSTPLIEVESGFPRINFVVPSLFSLPNTSGSIIVTTRQGIVIDEVFYDVRWHNSYFSNTKGISLERISPLMKTDDAGTWASAADLAGFSTPGAINSQFTNSNQQENRIDLSSEYFTPNGDGDKDLLLITIHSNGEFSCSIDIYDSNGIRMVSVCNSDAGNNSKTYKWDGADTKGKLCATGIYIVSVKMVNQSGTTIYKKVVTLKQ